jgi:methylglutaconyl-CoA hydratase
VSDVAVDREGPVLTLTLDRPDRRNALGPSLMEELAGRIGEAEADDDVRVVVLAGAGSAFSAGADIEWMRASRDLSREENLRDAVALREAFEHVDACTKAVIARVHGPAIGGGAGLVACADVAVAADGARFAFAEARLGLIPATIAPYVLRSIGPGHARALFTSARTFEAEEARRIGLVHHVVTDAALDATVSETAEAFLACGPRAVAEVKRLIRDATASLVLGDLSERIAAARASEEGQEGLAAFLEKRAPGWAPSSGS